MQQVYGIELIIIEYATGKTPSRVMESGNKYHLYFDHPTDPHKNTSCSYEKADVLRMFHQGGITIVNSRQHGKARVMIGLAEAIHQTDLSKDPNCFIIQCRDSIDELKWDPRKFDEFASFPSVKDRFHNKNFFRGRTKR